MAKRTKQKTKKEKQKNNSNDGASTLKSETLKGVIGLLAFAFAIVLALSGFNMAGHLGEMLFVGLSFLFGVGFWLVPFSLFIFAVAIFKSLESKISLLKNIGVLLSFVLGLTLIEMLAEGHGGVVGAFLAKPVVWAFDKVAGGIVVFAGFLASLLLIFDTHPKDAFPSLLALRKKLKTLFENEKQTLDEKEEQVIEKATQSAKPEKQTSSVAPVETVKKNVEKIVDFTKSKEKDLFDSLTVKQNFGKYTPPPLSILRKDAGKPSVGDIKARANAIKRTLLNFNISVEMDEVSIGPTVTRYALKPAEGVKLNRIVSLQSNLELALAASPIRIEAPIPGKSLVGIEVPNQAKATLGLASLLGHPDFQRSEQPLLVALGRDISGKPQYANLAKMPHLLIAGATGAGKSVTIHDLVVSLLYRNSPEKMRIVMVDPKRVELTLYNGIPHLMLPVVTDPKKALQLLRWLTKEMERRYDILEKNKVRDISSYHKNIYEKGVKNENGDEPESMPYIVAFLDELSDLMQAYPRELEAAIVRLAQMSRAVGIHLVLSTQRPSVKVITGLIKANVPARIALQVASQVDSRTILDMGGAEKLLGAGDMLFTSGEMSKPKRIQAPYISEDEVKKIVSYLKKQYEGELSDTIDLEEVAKSDATFVGNISSDEDDDPLFEQAKEIVVSAGKASTTYIQRKLRVGYARAARIMDLLEEKGVVGPAEGSKPRAVLIKPEDAFDENEMVEDGENGSASTSVLEDNDSVELIDNENVTEDYVSNEYNSK